MGWELFSEEQLIVRGLFFDERNINIAIEGLKNLKKIFAKYNVPFFLDCGTLLGCIREGKFIDIDIDIDIGVLGEHWNQEIVKEFKANPWESCETRFCKDQYLADLYFGGENRAVYFGCTYTIKSSRIPIDVYIHQKGKNEFNEQRINLLTGRKYTLDYFKSFVEKELCGVNFLVPVLYKEYLDDIYGKKGEWRIPLL